MGNVNWMRARESQLASELFGRDLQKILPIVRPGGSDSATFDNVLELLMLAGRSLPHAAMMMIPEAYRDRDDLPDELKGFYAFHSCLMEPWDGPAASASPTAASSARRSTATACAPGAGSRPRTATSSSAPRPACSTIEPGERRAPRPPAAGQALPRRPRAGPDRRGRGGQARGRHAAALRRVVRERNVVHFADLEPAHVDARPACCPAAPAPARLRLLAGGPARPARADGARRRGADRLDGQRHRARGALRPAARRCSATSSSSSRRSPTRRSTRSASRS